MFLSNFANKNLKLGSLSLKAVTNKLDLWAHAALENTNHVQREKNKNFTMQLYFVLEENYCRT